MVSSTGAAVGAGIVYNRFADTVTAQVVGGSITAPSIEVKAEAAAAINAFAAGGSGADKLAIAGAVIWDELQTAVKATVSGAASLAAGATVKIDAVDQTQVIGAAGAGSGSSGGAAVGAAFSFFGAPVGR